MMTLVTGCRIDHSKRDGNENVKIATPFGGMQVKTDNATVEQGLGLPIYPGAELVKKKDKDSGAADVNLSFGKFQLRVKAASYRTSDSPDKVRDFYMDAQKRYGTVIQCSDNKPVGTPTVTEQGLTCDNSKGHANMDNNPSGKIELKTGSKQHQHLVEIDPEGTGTKFGLVALDLPGNVTVDEDTRQ
jgi:hypothetical protein